MCLPRPVGGCGGSRGLGQGGEGGWSGEPAVGSARPSGHHGGEQGRCPQGSAPRLPPGNHLSECLFHGPRVLFSFLSWPRSGLMNGAQFRVGGRSAAGARA